MREVREYLAIPFTLMGLVCALAAAFIYWISDIVSGDHGDV